MGSCWADQAGYEEPLARPHRLAEPVLDRQLEARVGVALHSDRGLPSLPAPSCRRIQVPRPLCIEGSNLGERLRRSFLPKSKASPGQRRSQPDWMGPNLGAAPSSTVGSEVQPCDRQAGVGLSAFTHRFPPSRRPARTATHPPIRWSATRPRGLAAKPCTPLLDAHVTARVLGTDALRRLIRRSPSRLNSGGGSEPVGGLACPGYGEMTCVPASVQAQVARARQSVDGRPSRVAAIETSTRRQSR